MCHPLSYTELWQDYLKENCLVHAHLFYVVVYVGTGCNNIIFLLFIKTTVA